MTLRASALLGVLLASAFASTAMEPAPAPSEPRRRKTRGKKNVRRTRRKPRPPKRYGQRK
jgi:hypothetical protein